MDRLTKFFSSMDNYIPDYIKHNYYVEKLIKWASPYFHYTIYCILYTFSDIQIRFDNICPKEKGFNILSLYDINKTEFIDSNNHIRNILENVNRTSTYILKFKQFN